MRPILAAALVAGAVLPLGGCDFAAARSSDGDADDAVQRIRAEAATVDMGYTAGRADAPVAVVEFSDFGCPYCARFARATFPILTREFIEQGTVRWRYVPITFGFPGGELMGAAAICAAELGDEDTFWEVHDLFYTRQTALRDEEARPRLLDWVAELGVDRDDLDRCIDAPETTRTLQAHTEAAVGWYARGTPTFVVNGVPMAGALPVDFFRKVFATVLDPSGL